MASRWGCVRERDHMVRWIRKRAEVTLVLLRTNAGSQRTTLTPPKDTHHGLSVYLISERFHHHGHPKHSTHVLWCHRGFRCAEQPGAAPSKGAILRPNPAPSTLGVAFWGEVQLCAAQESLLIQHAFSISLFLINLSDEEIAFRMLLPRAKPHS